MHKLKNNFFYIIIGLFIAGCIIIIYSTFYNPNKMITSNDEIVKNEKIIEIINENIDFDKDMLPDTLKITNEKNLSSLINDALNDSVDTPEQSIEREKENSQENTLENAINNQKNNKSDVFKNITMISSDKFDCEYNGQKHSYRLIGIKNDGNPEAIKKMLENVKNVHIEYDTIKTNGEGRDLIYLWDGEPADDKSNLINLQIILNRYAITTYLNTSDMTTEVPNNKYATTFLKYQKYINQQ
jgi:hypothetical protein